jgi:hypothetical protein
MLNRICQLPLFFAALVASACNAPAAAVDAATPSQEAIVETVESAEPAAIEGGPIFQRVEHVSGRTFVVADEINDETPVQVVGCAHMLQPGVVYCSVAIGSSEIIGLGSPIVIYNADATSCDATVISIGAMGWTDDDSLRRRNPTALWKTIEDRMDLRLVFEVVPAPSCRNAVLAHTGQSLGVDNPIDETRATLVAVTPVVDGEILQLASNAMWNTPRNQTTKSNFILEQPESVVAWNHDAQITFSTFALLGQSFVVGRAQVLGGCGEWEFDNTALWQVVTDAAGSRLILRAEQEGIEDPRFASDVDHDGLPELTVVDDSSLATYIDEGECGC